MAKKGGIFTVGTLLGSFFGAALVAGAFAYFNYKFSEYKFIDFNDWIFYEKQDLFKPDQKSYLVVFYSSKEPHIVDKIRETKNSLPILAIDYYQRNFISDENVIFLKSGTETTLKFIQRFNIYDVPTVFIIKKVKESLYKQDSMIQKLKNLDYLSKKAEDL